jgi:hypothetical protein
MTERERVAVHEAGHAVAGFLLGRRPDWITIRPSDGFGGMTTYLPHAGGPVAIPENPPPGFPIVGMDARSRRVAETQMLTTLAGAAAERIYCGPEPTGRGEVSIEPPDLSGPVNDATAAFEMAIRQANPGVSHALIAYFDALAEDMARQPVFAALLGPLRDALLERETLSGAEVRRLLRKAKSDYERTER